MYSAIADLSRVLVGPVVAKFVTFSFVSPAIVLTNALNVFALALDATFALLQSRVHELWALRLASSLRVDHRYNPTDCFETFPFPKAGRLTPLLRLRVRRTTTSALS